MKHILFVDDEQQILDGLQNLLRKQRREWQMVFALGAQAALTELEKCAFDVIVSDMRMPGMDGASLLNRVKELYPRTARIILSGHAERDAVVRVLPVAHQFLSKPCDELALRNVIERACELQKLFEDKAILSIIGQVDKLPSVSETYWELTRALARPDTSTADVARIVEKDPAMCIKLLQIVNSAFFGLAQRMSSIQQAINYLGTELLRALVLTAHVFAAVEMPAVKGFSLEHLQCHSLATARLAKRLLGASPHAEEAFTAAVVHDVGKLILALSVPDRFTEVADEVVRTGRSTHTIEKEMLGVTHAEIGGYLLGIWGLPLPIVEAVVFHHNPSSCGAGGNEILAAVHFAEMFVDPTCTANEQGTPESRLDVAFFERVGLASEIPKWRTLAAADIARRAG